MDNETLSCLYHLAPDLMESLRLRATVLERISALQASAFPGSDRIYSECGSAGRVPLRAIHLSGGEKDVVVYDTSGPYGDPGYQIDIVSGLPKRRRPKP